jgi:hypothetical protein
MGLEYFESYYVLKVDDHFYLQKDVGEKPLGRDFNRDERDVYLAHLKHFERSLRQSRAEQRQMMNEKLEVTLKTMRPVSEEKAREIAQTKEIFHVVGFLTKEEGRKILAL